MKLETLKAYIETHLKTGFTRTFKSFAGASIFFDKEPDDSFCLCVNTWGLNNLSLKNWYPLLLISKALDCLGQVKQFI